MGETTCPKAYDGGSHHMVPVYNSKGEGVMRCAYCNKTEKQLREGGK